MKKTIKIVSISSLAIAALSLLVFLGTLTVFWRPLCMQNGGFAEVVARGPVVPIAQVVAILGCCVLAILVFIFANTYRSVVGEIVAVAMLAVVIPALTWYLSERQAYEVGMQGTTVVVAYSVTNNISVYAGYIRTVANALCLLVCGMSISRKVCTRKANYLD